MPKIVLFRNGNGLRRGVGTFFNLPRVRVVLVTEDAQYLKCALVSKETLYVGTRGLVCRHVCG